ncbi:MAG: hypothetical protein VKL42_04830 [Snowella sp.]|nr:hypothetical protein [Snowella sp.]
MANRLWILSIMGAAGNLGAKQINTVLVQEVRLAARREAEPSLAIIDSQSVKLGQKGGRNTESMAIRR